MNIRLQFLGLVGSGKSYLSHELATKRGGYVIPFAKKVYELATIVKGSPINKSLPQDRELLKLIGTTWGRESKRLPSNIHCALEPHKPSQWGSPDIWAKIFIEECKSMPKDSPIFNDDTRFQNELRIAGQNGGFIPIFVYCTETVRMRRLFARGDKKDFNDQKHQSEMLVNRLNKIVLARNLMPVVWNDDITPKPNQPWVLDYEKFVKLALECQDNYDLSKALNWNSTRLKELLAFTQKPKTELKKNLVNKPFNNVNFHCCPKQFKN